MANDPRQIAVEAALAGLKDFQRVTVETVYKRLFVSSQKSMLVADEVGLGKTIVAEGVIAMALRERMKQGNGAPFKVTYICSNQVIAGENIDKLNVFPDMDVADTLARRIAYLAYTPQKSDDLFSSSLVLNTLTPGTSFEISGGTGTKDERAIIYSVLCADPNMEYVRNGLTCLLRGTVQQHIDDFRRWMEDQRRWITLREGLAESFLSSIRNRIIKVKEAPLAFELLQVPDGRNLSIYDATYQMASILRSNNESNLRRACNEVARVLRRKLIDACLRYIDADLFILDEFQRFRNLIDPDSEAEEAEIARRVFQNQKARILLLSATPFKAFTGDLDSSNGDDHYRDFGIVLRFLTNDDKATLDRYEKHRRALYHQLLSLKKGDLDVFPEHRKEIEQILRRVMCRTERQIVAADPGAMILDKWQQGGIPFGLPDVRNYVATDQIAMALDKAYQGKSHVVGKPVEYCKSAPNPLSYLDGYALKKLLKACQRNESVREVLKQNRDAWLDTRKTNRYTLRIGRQNCDSGTQPFAHARLASLVEESIGSNGANLLWIPPSLPYYQLGGAFKDAAGFSKVLVFSCWVMVPRMIASLLSYEVERQTVGNPLTRESRETGMRRYFPPRNKPNYKRHPVPLLVYRAEDGDAATAKSMSNFCCLYPSLALANAYDPIASFQPTASVGQVRRALANRISEMIKNAGLAEYESSNGSPERWYWAAPALLDHAEPSSRLSISYWLHDDDFLQKSPFFEVQDRAESGKLRHFSAFRDAFCHPEKLSLGRMPANLPEVLADIALGSPAVTSVRTLRRLFPEENGKITKQHLRGAFEIAGEFLNLFNKPESICALRLSTAQADYWYQVLCYCGDGCLQAVMDEYAHLTKGQKGTLNATVAHMRDTISITASSINVNSLPTFLRGRPHKMRCHYAVDFGNQKLETEQGQQRATTIRENFNSPFRPFVLATTSIGQEGLDFHQYCRKIVHWNLPGNPIDLEQREGRINRYKGLVIRQDIAHKYSSKVPAGGQDGDVWDALFEIADQEERAKCGKCELVPYWHVDTDGIKIERIIPMYPFSRDRGKLETILKTLAIYRLAFGQPRQVELIEHLLQKQFAPEEIEAIRKNLIVNLSPIDYARTDHEGQL